MKKEELEILIEKLQNLKIIISKSINADGVTRSIYIKAIQDVIDLLEYFPEEILKQLKKTSN
jgi:hypothetical protein